MMEYIEVRIYDPNPSEEAQAALDEVCGYMRDTFSFESGFESWRGVWSGMIDMDDWDIANVMAKFMEKNSGDYIIQMKTTDLDPVDWESAFWVWYIRGGKYYSDKAKVVWPEPDFENQ